MAPTDDADGWTVVTLKAYFEQRFADYEKAVSAALAAAEKAVAAALAAAEKAREQAQADSLAWRNNANEWRGAMEDREAKFVSRNDLDSFRNESESDRKAIRVEIQSLRESRATGIGAEQRGRAVIDTGRSNIALAVSVIAVALLLMAAIVRYFGGR